ncbi:hypothetical protein HYP99_gp077 [Sinorhizobium phage ort11]|uniref:DUF1515 domain-containing protein n=1 Tax=Sinorhizobium phage ort11 TaxID=2599764 RepID=A0A5C2H3S2_9CAUD|nr:hypothetical protein HYP99_gp077 [Sinorhizobium phage ort11]QEP29875.1 hypothetical protein Smphiort11_077 [Sinorhizobium phage ort11]
MTDTPMKELGALAEALKNIERQLDEARDGRKAMYEKLERVDRKVDHLDWRVADLEKKLGTISPTVEEFATYKIQAQGAGKLGTFIWKLGGILLSMAAGAVGTWTYVSSFLTWK